MLALVPLDSVNCKVAEVPRVISDILTYVQEANVKASLQIRGVAVAIAPDETPEDIFKRYRESSSRLRKEKAQDRIRREERRQNARRKEQVGDFVPDRREGDRRKSLGEVRLSA